MNQQIKFTDLLKPRGVKAKLTKYLGISNNTMYCWVKGAKPMKVYQLKIARYFQIKYRDLIF